MVLPRGGIQEGFLVVVVCVLGGGFLESWVGPARWREKVVLQSRSQEVEAVTVACVGRLKSMDLLVWGVGWGICQSVHNIWTKLGY